MSKPVLGYWDIRGRAEPIRCMLHYVGQEFDEIRYKGAPTPDDEDAKQWFAVDKPKIAQSAPFPNIPYYKEGDRVMTQVRHVKVTNVVDYHEQIQRLLILAMVFNFFFVIFVHCRQQRF